MMVVFIGLYSLINIKYIYFKLILLMIIIGLLSYYRFVGLFRYTFLVHHEGFTSFDFVFGILDWPWAPGWSRILFKKNGLNFIAN
jgi:hypothetical protein